MIIYVGESVTLKRILKDIRDNSRSFHGGKDTLRVQLCDTGFSFGKYVNR
jgi:hypothetical protein